MRSVVRLGTMPFSGFAAVVGVFVVGLFGGSTGIARTGVLTDLERVGAAGYARRATICIS